MNLVTGINKTSTLEVLYKKLDDERNRIEIKYRVTHGSIEPDSQLGIDERTFYIQNKAAVLDEQGEVITPADNALDEFNDQILSRGMLDEAAKQKAIAHAQVALGFVEFTDTSEDVYNDVPPPTVADLPEWNTFIGVMLPKNFPFAYNGEAWRVRSTHTVQEQFPPSQDTLALYVLWPQPIDSNLPAWQPWPTVDPYGMGAQVTHNGLCWESANASNTWEPGAAGIGDNIWFQIDCP